MFYFNQHCWPTRSLASHVCCPRMLLMRVLKPFMFALMSKEGRSRLQIHAGVPESEILDVLSRYGITKEMLPTEMGGTVRLNMSEWIAQRRAIEMEEIS